LSDGPPELALNRIDGGVALWIHVTPRAKHPRIGGLHGDALRVGVAAAPVEGRANAACCEALATTLECSRRDVEIDPASKGRRKRVRIFGDSSELAARLRVLAEVPGVG
jgi:uncharacterized protein (TIGR00251 family)